MTAVLPDTNLVADVYDVAPDGGAILISRGGRLIPGSGSYDLELYGDDWRFGAGHRVGVLITGANAEWWQHAPTLTTVTVRGGTVSLPWLPAPRADDLAGTPALRLEQYRSDAPIQVSPATMAARTRPDFATPGPG